MLKTVTKLLTYIIIVRETGFTTQSTIVNYENHRKGSHDTLHTLRIASPLHRWSAEQFSLGRLIADPHKRPVLKINRLDRCCWRRLLGLFTSTMPSAVSNLFNWLVQVSFFDLLNKFVRVPRASGSEPLPRYSSVRSIVWAFLWFRRLGWIIPD